ncbi:c-type cytochrome [Sulfitobacter guttiformis]|uniref:Cytochrome c n=1 Tax=Sulfitobacter guttiformis TaxID=74349 RepID=J7G535_9RHOB|nr:c-type cytochrome [Sulfitobacter guttiformis]AFP55486.1 cytochrome c-551 [Sulfitobacter guttiformis]KIN75498.1 Cytochrome c-551 [Sulfitobacter guttiformis KCTC 32187]RKE92108.1 cytochrome c [Sulfitobacter guttiformis]
MKIIAATALGLALMSAPAFADGHATGDATAGESVFNKCKACHMISDADGNDIVKGGRTGPNLYGLYTRVAGSTDFRYGDSIVQAGEAGLEWNEEDFVAYVADPKKFLAEYNDDKRAKSKMAFKLGDEEDAANVWAYLVSVGPEVEAKAD